MTIEKAFGSVIRDLRRNRKLNWVELAKLTGVTYQPIWEIETGRAGPRLKLVFKLADALNVGADELMKRASFVYKDARVD
jgi:transcriptional regulator with XRE-family HTH domain